MKKKKSSGDENKSLIRQTSIIGFAKEIAKNRQAVAPYNFIPLNDNVFPAAPFQGFDRYATGEDSHTGYIECDIECLTPVFIRGLLTAKDYKDGPRSREKPDFFSPAKQIKIPGSSLRGMIRTLVEILTWSRLSTDERRSFYFRAFADQSVLRDEYMRRMNPEVKGGSSRYQMKAGYLRRNGTEYQITPAREIEGKSFLKVPHKEIQKKYSSEHLEAYFYGKQEPSFYKCGNKFVVKSGKMDKKKHDWVIQAEDENAESFQIPDTDVRNFKLDAMRNGPDVLSKADEFGGRARGQKSEPVPCFYVRWTDESGEPRVSFGHTAYFRLSYKHGVGDLLPEDIERRKTVDVAEAIFGALGKKKNEEDRKTMNFGGRVFFEDAVLTKKAPEKESFPSAAKILSSPKPTTFQHYLVQTSDAKSDLKYYDSEDAALRGVKMYWHKNEDWRASSISMKTHDFERMCRAHRVSENDFRDKSKSKGKVVINNIPGLNARCQKALRQTLIFLKEKAQNSVICPVGVKSVFKARIRFENLTTFELGALLSALGLPDGCCHKLGMGKPIGLGSVKLSPRLFLSKRKDRYQELWHEWMSVPDQESDLEKYKKAFEKELLEWLREAEEEDVSDLWLTHRMKQLGAMLKFANSAEPDWNERTRYLEIERKLGENEKFNEYSTRPVLPLPQDVVAWEEARE